MTHALAVLLLFASVLGGVAPADGRRPRANPPQTQPVPPDRDSDERPRAMAEPPEFAPLPQSVAPPGFVPVLTQRQKNCRQLNRCSLDPRDQPCSPCFGL